MCPGGYSSCAPDAENFDTTSCLPSGLQSAYAPFPERSRGEPPARLTLASVPPQSMRKMYSQPRRMANSSELDTAASDADGIPKALDSGLPSRVVATCAGSPSHSPL